MNRGKNKTMLVAGAMILIALFGWFFANYTLLSVIITIILAVAFLKGANWVRIMLIIFRGFTVITSLGVTFKSLTPLKVINLLLNLFIVIMLIADDDIKEYFSRRH